MQHILWSALLTSNGSTPYNIHHKMDERKLTIIRGDVPDDPRQYLVRQLFYLFINIDLERFTN